MQVSIAFAERTREAKPYPYPVTGSIRDEVFTRRGGMYFGIAHLLDYPAPTTSRSIASPTSTPGTTRAATPPSRTRSSVVSGMPLELDGDLVRHGGDRDRARQYRAGGARARARLDMGDAEIRRDLERTTARLRADPLYAARLRAGGRGRASGRCRARWCRIALQSPKITRRSRPSGSRAASTSATSAASPRPASARHAGRAGRSEPAGLQPGIDRGQALAGHRGAMANLHDRRLAARRAGWQVSLA